MHQDIDRGVRQVATVLALPKRNTVSHHRVRSGRMESPERAAIRRGLDDLKICLESYVADALNRANVRVTQTPATSFRRGADIQKLINEMLSNWQDVFAKLLPPVVRSY